MATPQNPGSAWDSLMQMFGGGSPGQANYSQASSQDPNASYSPMAAPAPQPTPSPLQAPKSSSEDPNTPAAGSRVIRPGGGGSFANFDRLMGKVNDQGLQSINDQRSHLDDLQSRVDQMPTSQSRPNLQGLNALADAWGGNGSTLAKDYNQPLNDQQLQALQAAAQEKVSGLQNNLSKDDLSLLKDQLSSELQKNMIQDRYILDPQLKAAGGDKDDRVVGRFFTAMSHDKDYISANSMTNEGNVLKGLLAQASTGNPDEVSRRFAAEQIPIAIARFNTHGQKINVPEINRAVSDPDWATRWNQTIASASGEGLDPVNASSMGSYIDNVMGSAKQNLENIRLDYANKVHANTSYDNPTSYYKLTGNQLQAATPTRTAPNLAQPGQLEPQVRVMRPDGKTGSIPKSQLQGAIQAGWKQAQ